MKLLLEKWNRYLQEQKEEEEEETDPLYGDEKEDATESEKSTEEFQNYVEAEREKTMAACADVREFEPHQRAGPEYATALEKCKNANEELHNNIREKSPFDVGDNPDNAPTPVFNRALQQRAVEDVQNAMRSNQVKLSNVGKEVGSIEQDLEAIIQRVQSLLGRVRQELTESDIREIIKEDPTGSGTD